MPKLRWLQKMGAGVDEIIEHWPLRSDVVLTRTEGKAIAPRMTEYVLGAISTSIHLDTARSQQQRRDSTSSRSARIRNLAVGIAGSVRSAAIVAGTLRALGGRAIGWRRSGFIARLVDECPPVPTNSPRFVGACDVVMLVLPLTRETKDLSGGPVSCCRRGTHIINIGRGGLIREQRSSTPSQPMSAMPHWMCLRPNRCRPTIRSGGNPHVTITPHICGPLVPEDVVPHFLANHAAFARGRPLQNVIDIERKH